MLSPVLFHFLAEPHSEASRIDGDDRYPHSLEPAEQILQAVAVVPGRARVAMRSEFPGSADRISPRVAVVARGRSQVAMCSEFPGSAEPTYRRVAAVVATKRPQVAVRSHFPGSAERISPQVVVVVVVAPALCAFDPSVAAPELVRVARIAPAAVFGRTRAAEPAPPWRPPAGS